MPVELVKDAEKDLVEIDVSGRLTNEDYHKFVPEVEQFLKEHGGKASLLFNMHNFSGWDFGGMWEDVRFGAKHRHSFPRLAMVGDKQWEKWTSKLCSVFLDSEVRFFQPTEITDARRWLVETH